MSLGKLQIGRTRNDCTITCSSASNLPTRSDLDQIKPFTTKPSSLAPFPSLLHHPLTYCFKPPTCRCGTVRFTGKPTGIDLIDHDGLTKFRARKRNLSTESLEATESKRLRRLSTQSIGDNASFSMVSTSDDASDTSPSHCGLTTAISRSIPDI